MIGTAEATEHPLVRRAREPRISNGSARVGVTPPKARLLGRGILGFLEAATVEWLEESDLDVDRAADLIHDQLWSGLGLSTAQAIPRDDTAIGAEALPQRVELLGCRRLGQAEGSPEPDADPVVTGRPHVEAVQVEDQEHVRRPGTDASGLGEHGDDLVVRHAADGVEADLAGDHEARQVV